MSAFLNLCVRAVVCPGGASKALAPRGWRPCKDAHAYSSRLGPPTVPLVSRRDAPVVACGCRYITVGVPPGRTVVWC
ncbi:hypothetical protein PENSPDRAFT_649090 [Peniophora sp. CONT]|nr:hypothetical protein PENSPDRAFT_649090 [Peniophora sp. CONT]